MTGQVCWQLGGTLLGACLLAVYALGEWAYAWVGWFALVPWLTVWGRCRTLKEVVTLATAGCAVFTAMAFYWFAEAISAYTAWPLPVAVLLLSAASVVLEPQFLVLAIVWYGMRARSPATEVIAPPTQALVAAAAYVACEWLTPSKILADTLGLGLWPVLEWVQAADLGGIYLLTFAVVFANACLACAVRDIARQRTYKRAVFPLALFAGTIASFWVYGKWRLYTFGEMVVEGKPQRELRIGVVQGNLSHYDQLREQLGSFGAVRYILDRYLDLTRRLPPNVDLWAWPETVYPTTFATPKSRDGAVFDREIAAFVQTRQRPLIFGAYDRDEQHEYNAAFVLIPEETGLRIQVQRKLFPFPFTEHVPEWLDTPALRKRVPWLGTWQPGAELEVVDVPSGEGVNFRLAVLICYDAVLPRPARVAAARGADVLLSLSNDSWFQRERGRRWALAASAFRSIETRRPQVRVTPTGISAVVEPSGRVRVLVAPETDGAAVATVSGTREASTLAVVLGDWVPWVSLAGFCFALLQGGKRTRRTRSLRAQSPLLRRCVEWRGWHHRVVRDREPW